VTRGRRVVADLVLGAILVGSGASIVTGRELWPFSPYPMFSTVRRGPFLEQLWFEGVLPDGTGVPIPGPRAFRPLRLAQLTTALERLPKERMEEALRDVLRRYGVERRAGRHDGPPLKGLRLYRMTFLPDPDPAGRDRPRSCELVAEVAGEG
jgi:hypothetical protein